MLRLIHPEEYYLKMAYLVASHSQDPSTQAGAILESTAGTEVCSFNHIAMGARNDIKIMDRDEKIRLIVHAEHGAILYAARLGIPTLGATMYAPWSPCVRCAQAIVEAGIARLVCHKPIMDATPERWRDEILAGLRFVEGGGVEVTMYDGRLDDAPEIRFDGRPWKP